MSPTNVSRLTPEPANEKDEGIAEEDPTELRLLLELNEQVSTETVLELKTPTNFGILLI